MPIDEKNLEDRLDLIYAEHMETTNKQKSGLEITFDVNGRLVFYLNIEQDKLIRTACL